MNFADLPIYDAGLLTYQEARLHKINAHKTVRLLSEWRNVSKRYALKMLRNAKNDYRNGQRINPVDLR